MILKRTRQYALYTLIFFLGYFVACGGGKTGTSVRTVATGGLTLQMLSSSLHRPAIFPANTSKQPVLASLFAIPISPDVTITNPSQLAQSYESLCDAYRSSDASSLHAGLGNSGLVSLNYLGGNICSGVLSSVGADETGVEKGFPIILAGSVNTLVAYGLFKSGTPFRCMDTTNVAALSDNTFVRAYFDLSHDAVILGSGQTQLSVTCLINIPTGDDIAALTVQWLKS